MICRCEMLSSCLLFSSRMRWLLPTLLLIWSLLLGANRLLNIRWLVDLWLPCWWTIRLGWGGGWDTLGCLLTNWGLWEYNITGDGNTGKDETRSDERLNRPLGTTLNNFDRLIEEEWTIDDWSWSRVIVDQPTGQMEVQWLQLLIRTKSVLNRHLGVRWKKISRPTNGKVLDIKVEVVWGMKVSTNWVKKKEKRVNGKVMRWCN